MGFKALDSANSKLLSNISAPQQAKAAGKASEADTVSLFSLNPAENAANAEKAQSPEMQQLAAQYSAEAQQKISENEAKNQAIFNQVVEKITQQVNDEMVAKAAALALRDQEYPKPEIEEKAANGGDINATPYFSANAFQFYFSLGDEVKYKAVVDGEVVNMTHYTFIPGNFSQKINDDAFKNVVKDYINEKKYLDTAQAMQKGEYKVLETDKDGAPLMTVSRNKDSGDVTFVCTKAGSYCDVTYKNEELGQKEQQIADSKSESKSAQETGSETDSKANSGTMAKTAPKTDSNFETAGSPGTSLNIANNILMPEFNTLT
jgi:hypothetical protein